MCAGTVTPVLGRRVFHARETPDAAALAPRHSSRAVRTEWRARWRRGAHVGPCACRAPTRPRGHAARFCHAARQSSGRRAPPRATDAAATTSAASSSALPSATRACSARRAAICFSTASRRPRASASAVLAAAVAHAGREGLVGAAEHLARCGALGPAAGYEARVVAQRAGRRRGRARRGVRGEGTPRALRTLRVRAPSPRGRRTPRRPRARARRRPRRAPAPRAARPRRPPRASTLERQGLERGEGLPGGHRGPRAHIAEMAPTPRTASPASSRKLPVTGARRVPRINRVPAAPRAAVSKPTPAWRCAAP